MMSPHWIYAQLEMTKRRDFLDITNCSIGFWLTESPISLSFKSASKFMIPVPRKLIIAVAIMWEYSLRVSLPERISNIRLASRIKWSRWNTTSVRKRNTPYKPYNKLKRVGLAKLINYWFKTAFNWIESINLPDLNILQPEQICGWKVWNLWLTM